MIPGDGHLTGIYHIDLKPRLNIGNRSMGKLI